MTPTTSEFVAAHKPIRRMQKVALGTGTEVALQRTRITLVKGDLAGMAASRRVSVMGSALRRRITRI